jgi:alpha-ribazole phosphatase
VGGVLVAFLAAVSDALGKEQPTIVLVRHPDVRVATGTCYGQLDVPINETHLNVVTERIASDFIQSHLPKPAHIITSPSQRCLRLANNLADITGAKLQQDPRWQELHFGVWEGLLWDDIRRDEFDTWGDHWLTASPPNGETYMQMKQRALSAWDALVSLNEPCLVVASSGPLKALWLHLHGLPDSGFIDQSWRTGEARSYSLAS